MPERVTGNGIERVFREEAGRSVAVLIRMLGDIDLAEDALQEAFAIAARTWPRAGMPPDPGAWIRVTARNRAIDRLRRDARGRELLDEAGRLAPPPIAPGLTVDGEDVPDERLRLIFTCCHPALSGEAQVALTLRLLGGMSTAEVARAFLVSESAMAQRLVRTKHKIKATRLPYRVPEASELPERLAAVLSVIYLVYTTGQTAGKELRAEAIRLARILVGLMPGEREAAGLLALLLLTESRARARTRPDGSLVVLGEQDRALWDRALIAEGQEIVRDCVRRGRPGPYQLQAAINAVHAGAPAPELTDWRQILALYDHLHCLTPTPVVALNRAIALSEVEGAAAGLAAIEELDLDGYHALQAARADLLRRLGRDEEADRAYARAAALAPTEAEREFLRQGGRFRSPRGPAPAR